MRYALINANPFSALELFTVNRDSGDLILIQSLDRESFSTITLVVTASDMGEPGEPASNIEERRSYYASTLAAFLISPSLYLSP